MSSNPRLKERHSKGIGQGSVTHPFKAGEATTPNGRPNRDELRALYASRTRKLFDASLPVEERFRKYMVAKMRTGVFKYDVRNLILQFIRGLPEAEHEVGVKTVRMWIEENKHLFKKKNAT